MDPDGRLALFLRFLGLYWRTFVIILTPLIFLPIPLIYREEKFRVLWLLLTLATFWVTEALPIGISSTMPIVFLPLMDVMSTEAVTMLYWKETTVMLIGSLMIALAIEHSNLHRRIALHAMLLVGCTQRRITLCLMCVSTFLSMWITNTATVAMMLPIGTAVLEEVQALGLCTIYHPMPPDATADDKPEPTNWANTVYLGIMYSATIGGTCTIIGTGTNLVLQGLLQSIFPKSPELDFGRFMLYSTPVMWAFMLFTWMWIQVLYMGLFRPNSEAAKKGDIGQEGRVKMQDSLRGKCNDMGPMSSHEAWVLAFFVIAIFMWMLRKPGFIPGWSEKVASVSIKDSTVSFAVIMMMFIIPMKWEWLNCFSCDKDKFPKRPTQGLITWKNLHDSVPWSLMFLVGSGFAMSGAGKKSGLNAWIAEQMTPLKSLPKFALMMLSCLICQALTEFSSNVAISNIVLPILAGFAKIARVHPMYFMVPAAISCSLAFNTGVGTPPNAIAKQTVFLTGKSLVKTGCVMSLVVWLWNSACFPTYGALIFGNMNEFPAWAEEA